MKSLAALGEAIGEPLQLSCVLEVIHSILNVHELKLAIGLLQHLSKSSLGMTFLPVSQDDFRVTLAEFLKLHKKRFHGEQATARGERKTLNLTQEHKEEDPLKPLRLLAFDGKEENIEALEQSTASTTDEVSMQDRSSLGGSPRLSVPMTVEELAKQLQEDDDILGTEKQLGRCVASPDGSESVFSGSTERGRTKMSRGSQVATSEMLRDLRKPGRLKDTLNREEVDFLATPVPFFVIHPTSQWRMCWDLTALVVILIEAILVPLAICYELEIHEVWFWWTTIFFTGDMFLNLITGYYQDGTPIMRMRWIAGRYMKTWFGLDFFSTFPWELTADLLNAGTSGSSADVFENATILKISKIGKIMRVFRLLRVVKLRNIMASFEDLIHSRAVMVGMSLTKMMCIFMFVCHWVACMWSFLGDATKVNMSSWPVPDPSDCDPGGPCEGGVSGGPWRRRYGIESQSLPHQYVTALHFATALIIGSEMDLQPGWVAEKLFVVAMMILSFLVCSTILSHIVCVVDKFSRDDKDFYDSMLHIKDFMASRQVPFGLQVKIKQYLKYQFRSRNDNQESGSSQEFMSHLSPWLVLELKEHLNCKTISRHPFFGNMPSECLKHICCKANSVLYAPQDTVFQKGHVADSMCFCVRGRLKVVGLSTCISAVVIDPGFWIGDLCIFQSGIRSHTCKSAVHSEILRIVKHQVESLCAKFPNVLKYYEAHKRRIENGDKSLLLCKCCQGIGHNHDYCPNNPDRITDDGERKVRRISALRRTLTGVMSRAPSVRMPEVLKRPSRQVLAGVKPLEPQVAGVLPSQSFNAETSLLSEPPASAPTAPLEIGARGPPMRDEETLGPNISQKTPPPPAAG